MPEASKWSEDGILIHILHSIFVLSCAKVITLFELSKLYVLKKFILISAFLVFLYFGVTPIIIIRAQDLNSSEQHRESEEDHVVRMVSDHQTDHEVLENQPSGFVGVAISQRSLSRER